MSSSPYYPHVDGLRAVSVALVVLYHAQLAFSGGFVGVDAFFVISGYLITGLLLRDLNGRSFSIRHFFTRRIRRILPAQWAVVVTTLFVSWMIILPSDFVIVLKTTLGNCFLSANVSLWSMIGYFNDDAIHSPLLHLWSLAVEEQFYLIFPFAFSWLFSRGLRFTIGGLLIATTISFGICVYASYKHPSACFFLLPFRAWELLIGSLLAVSVLSQSSLLIESRGVADLLGFAGFVMLLGCGCYYSKSTVFPGFAAILPCLSAVLLIVAGGVPGTWTNRILCLKPVIGLGQISYSLYLWHWPIIVFSGYWLLGSLSWTLGLLTIVFSVAVSYLSWKYIEQPFRSPGKSSFSGTNELTDRWISTAIKLNFTFAILALAMLVAEYQPLMPPSIQQYANGVRDRSFLNEVSLEKLLEEDLPQLGVQKSKVDVLLWGDSHAMAAAPAIDILCRKYRLSGAMVTYSSTPPLLGFTTKSEWGLNEKNLEYSELVIELVKRERIRCVVMAGVWESYVNYERDHVTKRFDVALNTTVKKLHETGCKVIVMLEVPRQSTNYVSRLLAREAFMGRDVERIGASLSEHRSRTSDVNQRVIASCQSMATVLDPTPAFLNDAGNLRCAYGGYSLYADASHLTTHGAEQLVQIFDPVFEALVDALGDSEVEHSPTPKSRELNFAISPLKSIVGSGDFQGRKD